MQGFKVGRYNLDFNIDLNITTTTVLPGPPSPPSTPWPPGAVPAPPPPLVETRTTEEVLTINPSAPYRRDSSRRLSAKLLGDLETYSQVPNLDGKWLFLPMKHPSLSKHITLGCTAGRGQVWCPRAGEWHTMITCA